MEVDRKLMDYLARRAHSEKELRTKLLRKFPLEEVERAISHAKKMGWLENEHELASRVADELGRKGKGHRFIELYLLKKGLPQVTRDRSHEREKALQLIVKYLKLEPPFSHTDRADIFRLLKNRGYDYDTIQGLFRDPF